MDKTNLCKISHHFTHSKSICLLPNYQSKMWYVQCKKKSKKRFLKINVVAELWPMQSCVTKSYIECMPPYQEKPQKVKAS